MALGKTVTVRVQGTNRRTLMSQVADSLNRLSENVTRHYAGMADARIGMSNAATNRLMARYQIQNTERNRANQQPGIDLQNAQIADQRRQVTLNDLHEPEDPLSFIHLIAPDKSGKPMYKDILEKGLGNGAKMDAQNRIFWGNGKPVELWEYAKRGPQVSAVIMAKMDLPKMLEDTKTRKVDLLASGKVEPGAAKGIESDIAMLDRALAPENRVKLLERWNSELVANKARFSNIGADVSLFDAALERNKSKIQGEMKAIETRLKYEHEEKLKTLANPPGKTAQAAWKDAMTKAEAWAKSILDNTGAEPDHKAKMDHAMGYFGDTYPGLEPPTGEKDVAEQVTPERGATLVMTAYKNNGGKADPQQVIEFARKNYGDEAAQIVAQQFQAAQPVPAAGQATVTPQPVVVPESGNIGRGPRKDPSARARKEAAAIARTAGNKIAALADELGMSPEDLAGYLKFVGQTPEEYRQSLLKNKDKGSF